MTNCKTARRKPVHKRKINKTRLVPRRAYTILEFCEAFRVSRPTVYKLFALDDPEKSELDSVVRGGRRLIPIESAEKWWQGKEAQS